MLQYPKFRRLWFALSLSSLGDWLGLLATTSLAASLRKDSFSGASFAIGAVLFFRLLPAVVLGPLAGVFADRFERRTTMVVCDILRFGVFLSIPFVHSLGYLLAASFMAEAISLFWIPAKEASVPNLLPRHKLEVANQLSLITTYGSAPVAAAVFAGLAKLSDALGAGIPFFKSNPTNLALYFDAGTFLFSAITVMRLGDLGSPNRAARHSVEGGFLADLTSGWKFVGQTPLVRGLVVGILGAFAAGGTVIATGRIFVSVLGGGEAAYGMLFGAVFTGLAVGMGLGPRMLGDFSRRRMFGLSIMGAGSSLAVMSLLPNLILALFATVFIGAFAGIAWITGYTLLGAEVENEVRGRTFAVVQSLVRIDLLVVLAAAPVIAGAISTNSIGVGRAQIRMDGVTLTLFGAGLLATAVGFLSYRQMDDGREPLWRELVASVNRMSRPKLPGILIAFEGGEGAGKSTQVQQLAAALSEDGHDVVTSLEPGATALGKQIRALLLAKSSQGLAPLAEALLYAADRAQHVAEVVRPALERGAVVVTDRYVDSSLAYQGGGRDLSVDEVARLSGWATGNLTPDLTVVLDVPPEVGLGRITAEADRLESESMEFHVRVREAFRALATRAPYRYLVVDATESPEAVHKQVLERVNRLVHRREGVR